MKPHKSISHFNGKEQDTVHFIKSKIIEILRPAAIFLVGSRVCQTLNRSCFASKSRQVDWSFSFDLVVVLPNETSISEEQAISKIEALVEPFGKVQAIVHHVDYFEAQLNAKNFFFSWIQRSGIVLYEKNFSSVLPGINNKEACLNLYPQTYEEYKSYLKEAAQYLEAGDVKHSIEKSLQAIVKAAIGYDAAVDRIATFVSMSEHHAEVALPAFIKSKNGLMHYQVLDTSLDDARELYKHAEDFYSNNPKLFKYAKVDSVQALNAFHQRKMEELLSIKMIFKGWEDSIEQTIISLANAPKQL